MSLQVSVDTSTNLYGIFGNPVKHSLSPLIHNAAFAKYKVNATYLAFQVEEEGLELAFEAMRALHLNGVNITIPFKEAAFNLVDEVPQDLDRAVGAINTVVNKAGKLYGYNTDVLGFLGSLREGLNFQPKDKKILVLGAGGAARAIVFALAYSGAESVVICNRTYKRSEGLQHYAMEHFPESQVDCAKSAEALKGATFDLVVNATALGMQAQDLTPFDLSLLKGAPAVFDIVYAPHQTPLLKQAEQLRCPHLDGLGMLASQAALSFALWTGKNEGVKDFMVKTLKESR